MIELREISSIEKRDNLRFDYMKKLIVPIDGFWENVVIGNSKCYEIIKENIMVGHFSVNSEKTLVQFHILDKYFRFAPEIFQYIIKSDHVENAAVCTMESSYLSLCLDNQNSISVESYLFHDCEKVECKLKDFTELMFRFAKESDLKLIIDKCGLPFEGYYEEMIKNNQLFVLYNRDAFLGIGEFRISKTHSQFADIGMIVVEEYRKKGIGTYIITKLKEHCYKNNVTAIASCDSTNIASKRTLEKSGLISEHRIIKIEFEK